MDEAEYCGRISIMHAGKILAMDTPSGLKASTGFQTVEDVFISYIEGSKSV